MKFVKVTDRDDITVDHKHMGIYLASCVDGTNITVTQLTKKSKKIALIQSLKHNFISQHNSNQKRFHGYVPPICPTLDNLKSCQFLAYVPTPSNA